MTSLGAVDLQALRPGPEYWEHVARGEVPYQRCGACDAVVSYPRVVCPSCGATSLSWQVSSGRGIVYSATTVHVRDAEPYTVALVDLQEGVRVMVRIDDAVPDDPPIGSPVLVAASELDGKPALRAAFAGDDEDA
ncbi:MAG TPA: OB-fold domain-containing protein [Solirubrobacteraceae bacterium]